MNRRPRICFVIPHGVQLFFPQVLHRHGGAEVQLALLARELARGGEFEVAVALGAFGQPRRALVEDITCLAYRYGGALGALELQAQLWRSRADVCIQRAMGSTTRQVYAFCRWARRRFVYWMAADLDARPPLHLDVAAQAAAPTRTAGYIRALHGADLVVAQHLRQQRLLREHEGLESVIIPNGLPPRPRGHGERRHHLWIGHCNAIKNPRPVLELARTLPAERFVMVVPPEGAHAPLMAELREAAATLPNLDLRGRVPFAEIDTLFDGAQTYLMTSVAEGFPNTVLQACWAGVPSLSLHIDLGELLGADYPLPHAGGQPGVLIDQLRELAGQPERRLALGDWVYARAAERFSIAAIAGQLAAELRRLMA